MENFHTNRELARRSVVFERSPDFSKDQQRSGRVTRIQVSRIEVKFCRVTEDPALTLGRVENLGTAVQGLSATRERAAER